MQYLVQVSVLLHGIRTNLAEKTSIHTHTRTHITIT